MGKKNKTLKIVSHENEISQFPPSPVVVDHFLKNRQTLIGEKKKSEKLFEMLSDQIECDRKNRFLPLHHFRNNLSFTYINTFSKKSSQDEFGSNLERIVSYTQTIGINTIHGKRPGVLMVP
jgi:hypothetical protein